MGTACSSNTTTTKVSTSDDGDSHRHRQQQVPERNEPLDSISLELEQKCHAVGPTHDQGEGAAPASQQKVSFHTDEEEDVIIVQQALADTSALFQPITAAESTSRVGGPDVNLPQFVPLEVSENGEGTSGSISALSIAKQCYSCESNNTSAATDSASGITPLPLILPTRCQDSISSLQEQSGRQEVPLVFSRHEEQWMRNTNNSNRSYMTSKSGDNLSL